MARAPMTENAKIVDPAYQAERCVVRGETSRRLFKQSATVSVRSPKRVRISNAIPQTTTSKAVRRTGCSPFPNTENKETSRSATRTASHSLRSSSRMRKKTKKQESDRETKITM